MKFKLKDKVFLNAKVMIRPKEGDSETVVLKNEKGTIVKIDKKISQYYVKTKYGVQLVAEQYLSVKKKK